jgi:hypothetical protein
MFIPSCICTLFQIFKKKSLNLRYLHLSCFNSPFKGVVHIPPQQIPLGVFIFYKLLAQQLMYCMVKIDNYFQSVWT